MLRILDSPGMVPAFLAALALVSAPGEPAPSARDLAQKALDNNLFSMPDASASLTIFVEKNGKVIRERRIRTKMKRQTGLVRALVEFEFPAEVAGTRFLSIEAEAGHTEQFIYLPAFKKVKRIVGSQRTQSFMGTDFAFSDLEGREVDDSVWTQLKDERVQGQDCFVIQGTPKQPDNEAYGKIVTWIDKQHFIPLAANLFAKDAQTIEKRLEVKKLQKRNDRVIATESVMSTPAKGTSTRLIVASLDLETTLPDELFLPASLER